MPNLTVGTLLVAKTGDSSGSATAAEVTAIPNTFTQLLKGMVPPPSTIQGYVLSDNGTWIPAGSTNASDLDTGTLDDALLSANVPIMVSGVLPAVDGSLLTNLPVPYKLTDITPIDRVITSGGGPVTIKDSTGTVELLKLEDSLITGAASIVPNVTSSIDLGASGNTWRNAYVDKIVNTTNIYSANVYANTLRATGTVYGSNIFANSTPSYLQDVHAHDIYINDLHVSGDMFGDGTGLTLSTDIAKKSQANTFSNSNHFQANLTVDGITSVTGETNPGQITTYSGTQDNTNIWQNQSLILHSNASAFTVTGMNTSGDGATKKRIINAGAGNLTLRHLNGGSSGANQFASSTGADVVLSQYQAVDVERANNKWVIWKKT